jgi:hypothetical protein
VREWGARVLAAHARGPRACVCASAPQGSELFNATAAAAAECAAASDSLESCMAAGSLMGSDGAGGVAINTDRFNGLDQVGHARMSRQQPLRVVLRLLALISGS